MGCPFAVLFLPSGDCRGKSMRGSSFCPAQDGEPPGRSSLNCWRCWAGRRCSCNHSHSGIYAGHHGGITVGKIECHHLTREGVEGVNRIAHVDEGGPWTAQQLRQAFPFDQTPKYRSATGIAYLAARLASKLPIWEWKRCSRRRDRHGNEPT